MSILYPRRPRKLPVVLSREEVDQFFSAIQNLRYRAMLMTAYGAGLRISEVSRLKVADIDSSRMVIRVEQGKGSKDRYVKLYEVSVAIDRGQVFFFSEFQLSVINSQKLARRQHLKGYLYATVSGLTSKT